MDGTTALGMGTMPGGRQVSGGTVDDGSEGAAPRISRVQEGRRWLRCGKLDGGAHNGWTSRVSAHPAWLN